MSRLARLAMEWLDNFNAGYGGAKIPNACLDSLVDLLESVVAQAERERVEALEQEQIEQAKTAALYQDREARIEAALDWLEPWTRIHEHPAKLAVDSAVKALRGEGGEDE